MLYKGTQPICPIITVGTTPTGTLSITQNGTYDVTNYASADVNVSGGGGGGIPYTGTLDSTNMNYIIKAENNLVTMDKLTVYDEDLGENTELDINVSYEEICSIFNYGSDNTIIKISMPLGNATLGEGLDFYECSNLAFVDLSALYYTDGNNTNLQSAFAGCPKLTYLNLSNIPEITKSSGAKNLCANSILLKYVNLDNLTTLGISGLELAFSGCTSLKTFKAKLLSLVNTYALKEAFKNSGIENIYFNSLNSSSFGRYKTQFNNMLSGVTGCTVHFPSNLQSVIGSWSDVTGGFGGTNTTVLFDLPATS